MALVLRFIRLLEAEEVQIVWDGRANTLQFFVTQIFLLLISLCWQSLYSVGSLNFGRNIVDSPLKNCAFEAINSESDLEDVDQDRCRIPLQVLISDEVDRDLIDNVLLNVLMALRDVVRLDWHPFVPPVWIMLIVIANELQSVLHREKIFAFGWLTNDIGWISDHNNHLLHLKLARPTIHRMVSLSEPNSALVARM